MGGGPGLEAELVERTAGEAAARAAERGRAAAAAALSDDLGVLRTTRRRQLEEVHSAAVAAANEAEAATRLQLAAGVVVVKRGRNGRLYRRVVRCNLEHRILEWARSSTHPTELRKLSLNSRLFILLSPPINDRMGHVYVTVEPQVGRMNNQ